jgi:pyruvate dehydrogenase phosphatase
MNFLLEDRQAQARIHSSDSNMYLFGVFDGHGGPWCSDVVGQRLFEYIAVTLHAPDDLQRIMQEAKRIISNPQAHIHSHSPDKTTSNSIGSLLLHSYYYPYKDTRNSKIKEIHQMNLLKHIEDAYTNIDHDHTEILNALESAFIKLDRDICAEAIPSDTQHVDEDLLQICTAGSCACVALVKDDDLYIANCGDARAILGTIDDQGNQTVINLSQDHNIRNQSEVKRVLSEHPTNESHSVIRSDRLLGLLMPFRAFGDIRFKWPANYLREYLQPYYKKGDAIPQFYLTPPYLTVKPDIIKYKLTKKDKFLLLATDGVWDLLSPEKVVELIFNHQKGIQSFDQFVLHKTGNPTSLKLKEINQLLLARQQAIQNQPIDQNSATHLIRQALAYTSKGQFDSKLLSDVLTFPNPRSIRDDITITVVYFDQDYIDHIQTKK